MLRLSPLPAPPDELKTETSLASESASGEQIENPQAEQLAEQTPANKNAASPANFKLPKDRYVAPEMAQWARIYRIGHDLLIPTHINDSQSMLFSTPAASPT